MNETPTGEDTPTSETETNKAAEKAASFCALKKWRPNKLLAVACILIVAVGAILLCSETWLFQTWDSLSADEILYHLRTSLEGTNSSMVTNYLLECGTKELAIIVAAAALLIFARKRKALYRALVAALITASVAATAYTVYDLDQQIDLFDYLDQAGSTEDTDFIEKLYVNPGNVDLTFPEQKRNVIYLMLESMEITYADTESGGAFDENVIPELTDLAREYEDFSGTNESGSASAGSASAGSASAGSASAGSASAGDPINGAYTLPGCTWTMGGMFALTSGLPLKLPFSGNQLETADSFYPGITAMGDILADEGYTQELLLGSDAVFGGRELFFTQHGDFAMRDYKYALEEGLIPEGYHVFWGYEDERLFDIAKLRLLELATDDAPFNLTMLTVDTHFEDGYVCELCDDEFGDNQYANVMACSSRQVVEFIEWVQRQPFYENTTIVVCGDHTTMDADFCEDISEDYERRVFTAVINGAATPELSAGRLYSTIDLFPTTLAAMGVDIPGDQLGLGINLYSNSPTLVELYGLDRCQTELNRQSDFMDAFSEVVVTERDLAKVAESAQLKAKVALGPKPESEGLEGQPEGEGENAPNAGAPNEGSLSENDSDTDDLSEVDAVLRQAPEGTVVFTLEKCYSLNSEIVLGATLAVTDTRTGAVVELPMTLVQNRPNYFWHTCITEFTEEDLPYLSAVASFTLDGFGEREIAVWDAATEREKADAKAAAKEAAEKAAKEAKEREEAAAQEGAGASKPAAQEGSEGDAEIESGAQEEPEDNDSPPNKEDGKHHGPRPFN